MSTMRGTFFSTRELTISLFVNNLAENVFGNFYTSKSNFKQVISEFVDIIL